MKPYLDHLKSLGVGVLLLGSVFGLLAAFIAVPALFFVLLALAMSFLLGHLWRS